MSNISNSSVILGAIASARQRLDTASAAVNADDLKGALKALGFAVKDAGSAVERAGANIKP